jgi:4-oxalocrotonate tautomerase family enzyme
MPYWKIQTPVGAYTAAEKKELCNGITDMYVDAVGLPRFYVVVAFEEVPSDNFYVGGEPVGNFVRVIIDHIARQLDTEQLRQACMDWIEMVLEPLVKDRGFDWEVHVDETPIELWRTQGLVPPDPWSEQEMQWAKDNKATPYEALVQ